MNNHVAGNNFGEKNFGRKNFVIAGGSRGIGLSLVRSLAASDANVHVCSRTQGDLTLSGSITHHVSDFSADDVDLGELPMEIQGAAYCPGTINLRSFRGLTLDDFRRDFEINLLGAVKFLKACLPGLKQAAGSDPASVVLFSTVAVGNGFPLHASVAAAKGAVEGLTRSLAAEWAPAIRVNCLAPALTDTTLTASLTSTPEKRAAMAGKYPLNRLGEPNDLASMARVLLSPESSWITGQVIAVDGGMSTLRG